MNKKLKNQKNLMVIVLLVGLVIAYLVFKGGIPGLPTAEGGSNNGIYNTATGECEARPGTNGFFTCCYNADGQQVDCNNPSTVLGSGHGQVFAIYQGTPGTTSISHGFGITNTGNVDITSARITNIDTSSYPTYSSGESVLDAAYSGIINSPKAISIGSTDSWSSAVIDLQSLSSPGVEVEYSIDVDAAASASGVDDVTKTESTSFTVESEGIDFNLQINL